MVFKLLKKDIVRGRYKAVYDIVSDKEFVDRAIEMCEKIGEKYKVDSVVIGAEEDRHLGFDEYCFKTVADFKNVKEKVENSVSKVVGDFGDIYSLTMSIITDRGIIYVIHTFGYDNFAVVGHSDEIWEWGE